MASYVIDSSVAVEYLLGTPVGLTIADVVENNDLVAPELLDIEVLSALQDSYYVIRFRPMTRLMPLERYQLWR